MHRRMCELTLIENTTLVNLALHAFEGSEVPASSKDGAHKEGAKSHHSDDEVTNTNQSASLGTHPIKAVCSEPVLKNNSPPVLPAAATERDNKPEPRFKSDSSFESEPGIQFVASSTESCSTAPPHNSPSC